MRADHRRKRKVFFSTQYHSVEIDSIYIFHVITPHRGRFSTRAHRIRLHGTAREQMTCDYNNSTGERLTDLMSNKLLSDVMYGTTADR